VTLGTGYTVDMAERNTLASMGCGEVDGGMRHDTGWPRSTANVPNTRTRNPAVLCVQMVPPTSG
jgi:hypothetical protein